MADILHMVHVQPQAVELPEGAWEDMAVLCCGNARDAADAVELMNAIGITREQARDALRGLRGQPPVRGSKYVVNPPGRVAPRRPRRNANGRYI